MSRQYLIKKNKYLFKVKPQCCHRNVKCYSTYNFKFFIVTNRREEAVNRPKQEFVPKTLADLHIEGISDGISGK